MVEAPLDVVDLSRPKAAAQGDAGERSVVAVDPAVILAAEELGAPILVLANRRAAVGAAVDEAVDLPVLVAADDDRDAADIGGLVVAGLGNLGGVADVHPGGIEDALELSLEDLFVRVQA